MATVSTVTPAAESKNGTCCVCFRPVYAMEAIVADLKFYHKACFRCAECHRTLSLVNFKSHNGWIYCSSHVPKGEKVSNTLSRRKSDELLSPRTPKSESSLWAPREKTVQHTSSSTSSPNTKREYDHGKSLSVSDQYLMRNIVAELRVASSLLASARSGLEMVEVDRPNKQASPRSLCTPKTPREPGDVSRPHSANGSPAPRSIGSSSSSSFRRTNADAHRSATSASQQAPHLDTIPDSPNQSKLSAKDHDDEYFVNEDEGEASETSFRKRPAPHGLRIHTGANAAHRRHHSADHFAGSQERALRYSTNVRASPTSYARNGARAGSLDSVHSIGWHDKRSNESLAKGQAPGLDKISQWTSDPAGLGMRQVEASDSMRSLVQLSVDAIRQMEEEGQPDRVSAVSLDGLTLKRKGNGAIYTSPSVSSLSSAGTLPLLAELAHSITVQGKDLISLYEAFSRLRLQRKSIPGGDHSGADTSTAPGRKAQMEIAFTVFRGVMDNVRKVIEVAGSLVPVKELRQYAVTLTIREREAEKEIANEGICASVELLKQVIQATVSETHHVVAQYTTTQKKLLIMPAEGYRLEACGIETDVPVLKSRDGSSNPYTSYLLEHIDLDAEYYRRHFLGQEHSNYIGDVPKLGPVIISLMYRPGDKPSKAKHDQDAISEKTSEYWAIMRMKDTMDFRAVIQANMVNNNSVLRSKPDAKSVLQMLHRDLIPGKLRKASAEGIEQKLVTLDEVQIVTRYKFGVLYCKGNQTSEEEYFSNEHGSPGFEKFLSFLGDKIELQGWTGYAAGLDTRYGQTGKNSIFTKWRENDVMFHVSTYLPFKKEDRQQIQRKRHIGNDIVCIVFMDGEGRFNPLSVKSQFLHVFIGVQEDHTTRPGQVGYRLVLASNTGVPAFGPPLPNPPVFWDPVELHDFLLAKMINAENAAYRAPKFRKPHNRTRNAMIDEIIREYCNPTKSRQSIKNEKRPDSVITNPTTLSEARSSITSAESPSPRTSESAGRRTSVFGRFIDRRQSVADKERNENAQLARHPSMDAGAGSLAHSRSFETLTEPKKKGLNKLWGSKGTKLDADSKAKARSTNLSSSESLSGDAETRRRAGASGTSLLSAFKRKDKEKRLSRSMESVDKSALE